MKYLGIDYGKNNIGIAISDSSGKVAMPFSILDNNKKIFENFLEIIKKEKIEVLIFGTSLNLGNKENNINLEIKKFSKMLIKFLKETNKIEENFFPMKEIKIFFQDERFSSVGSRWGLEKQIRRTEKKQKTQVKKKKIDDKAATLILQTFLDKKI